MKKLAVIILACAVALMGCNTFTAMMVPVEGPLSANPASLKLEFTGDSVEHGSVKVIMPEGETCTGQYTVLEQGRQKFPSETYFNEQDYIKYFGHPIPFSHKNYGQALLVGDKGTSIQAEFLAGSSSPPHGYGLAKDNKGNVFKLIF